MFICLRNNHFTRALVDLICNIIYVNILKYFSLYYEYKVFDGVSYHMEAITVSVISLSVNASVNEFLTIIYIIGSINKYILDWLNSR